MLHGLLPTLSLLPAVISDFCRRGVYIWQLWLFGITNTVAMAYVQGVQKPLFHAVTNVGILALMAIGVLAYLKWRYRHECNRRFVAGYIGWGDVIFLLLLTVSFTPQAFLYFLIGSLSLTLVVWGIYRLLGGHSKQIPLVSALGLCYMSYLICSELLSY